MPYSIISFIVMSITFIFIGWLIMNLHIQKVNSNENDFQYTIRFPDTFIKVCCSMFVFGIILFLLFFVMKFVLDGDVDIGCLIFAAIFAAIGLFATLYSYKWKLSVNGEQMELKRFLHSSKKITINEIERAIIENKEVENIQTSRVTLYVNGHKWIAIEDSMPNYIRLYNGLRRYGKLN